MSGTRPATPVTPVTEPVQGSDGDISDAEELSPETNTTHIPKPETKPMMEFVPLLEDGPAPYRPRSSPTHVNNSGVRPAALGMEILSLL